MNEGVKVMSNAYDEFAIESDDNEGGNAVKVLRAKLEKAVSLLKEKDTEITSLKTSVNERSVDDYLKNHKVPEKFHKLAKRELKDNPTEDAFKSFLDEYGDLWGAEDGKAPELTDEQKNLQGAVDRIEAARQEALGGDKKFQMPSHRDLARMNPAQLAALMEQVQNSK